MNKTLLEQAIREARLKKIIAEIKKEYSLFERRKTMERLIALDILSLWEL